jgi:hypothetical protein
MMRWQRLVSTMERENVQDHTHLEALEDERLSRYYLHSRMPVGLLSRLRRARFVLNVICIIPFLRISRCRWDPKPS